jgi:hypothetical protein
MTQITSELLADMHARRIAGETVADIAARYDVKPMTIYQAFRRAHGGTPLPGPANDNNPNRVTRMSARNGGCSTTSGLVPCTLVRIPSIDGPAGHEGDGGQRQPLQVAA